MNHHSFGESPTLKKFRELLGVTEHATSEELKKAYHQRAFLYHPDRNADPRAAEQFQDIRRAYETLSDPVLVATMKRTHLKEKLYDFCVEGLRISFGSFFGYRVFVSDGGLVPREHRLGTEETKNRNREEAPYVYLEEDRSILDDPAFDSIEVVYAGRFSSADEDRLVDQGRQSRESELPWVILNNSGILDFLNGDYRRSLRCYEELNRRIDNNIIFLYREALCHIVMAFQNPRRNFLGKVVPERKSLQRGVFLLRKCIRLGESRQVGRQKCFVIRKVLADVLERTGRKRAALSIWKDLRKMSPYSVEASFKTGDRVEALRLLKRKSKARIPSEKIRRTLLTGPMSPGK